MIEQLDTRTVYRNAWMTVREDCIAWPDGTTGIYGVVDKPDFALIIRAYGFCSQGFDVFLATELTAGEPAREPGEQDMVHRFVTDAELTSMILTGGVVDAATIAAHALLQLAGSPRAQA